MLLVSCGLDASTDFGFLTVFGHGIRVPRITLWIGPEAFPLDHVPSPLTSKPSSLGIHRSYCASPVRFSPMELLLAFAPIAQPRALFPYPPPPMQSFSYLFLADKAFRQMTVPLISSECWLRFFPFAAPAFERRFRGSRWVRLRKPRIPERALPRKMSSFPLLSPRHPYTSPSSLPIGNEGKEPGKCPVSPLISPPRF